MLHNIDTALASDVETTLEQRCATLVQCYLQDASPWAQR